jgi:hypothetical protein
MVFGISMGVITSREKTPIIIEPNINDNPKLTLFLIKTRIMINAIITPARLSIGPGNRCMI